MLSAQRQVLSREGSANQLNLPRCLFFDLCGKAEHSIVRKNVLNSLEYCLMAILNTQVYIYILPVAIQH